MNIINIAKKWYKNLDVKYQIIKYTKDRELAFITPAWANKLMKFSGSRMWKCHNTQGLSIVMEEGLGFWKHNLYLNLYYSIGSYSGGIPNQSLNLTKKDNTYWNEHHTKNMKGYDLFIDIDASTHDDVRYAWLSAKNITDYYDKHNAPYELCFSGKGFHIITRSEYLPFVSFNPKDKPNNFSYNQAIAKALNEKFSEMVDINIFDSRRVCKIPYSLALYEDGVFVAHQFETKEEFDNFELNDFRVLNYPFTIRERQRKIFNSEGFMLDMIKDLGLDGD